MAVARRASRQVGTAALPGARLTATETDTSAGVGVELARARKLDTVANITAGAADRALGKYAQVVAQERQAANETALLKANNQIEAWRRSRLYDPEKGALTLKGEASMPLPEQIADEFETLSSEIAAGLTPEQRLAFDRDRAQTFATVDLEVRRHVFGEMQEFRRSELKAAVDLGVDAAIRSSSDPQLVAVHLSKVEAQMRTNLPRLGVGKEQLEEQVAAVRSNVHVGVINNLLETSPAKARAYFEEAEGQITAERLDDVRKALEAGSVREESQTIADTVLDEGGSLREQLTKVRGMKLEPEVRDAVVARLEHDSGLREREERDTKEQTMRSAYDVVDKTGTVDKIPASTWASLDGSTRSALIGYQEAKARGIPIKTDIVAYYGLMRDAMNNPEAFANANLLEHKAKLDDTEFKQLAGLQLAIRNGARDDAEKVLADFRTSNTVVDDALIQVGINPNANPSTDRAGAVAGANLRQMVDTRVRDLQQLTGKKASSKDVQAIVDELLAASVSVPGTWLGAFTDAPFWNGSRKPAVNVTIDDISAEHRKQVEDALRSKGRPISDATVLQTYIEAIARGKIK